MSAIYSHSPSFLRHLLGKVVRTDIGRRITKGILWSTAGSVCSRLLMLGSNVMVARILGKASFGELGMVQSTIGMFGAVAGFGLGLTATKYVAELRVSDPQKAGRILGLTTVVAVVTAGLMAALLVVSADWIAEHAIHAPHLAPQLRTAAAVLFLTALNGAQTGALSGFEAFRSIAQINVIVGMISFPIMLLGACFWHLTGVLWALGANAFFSWLISHLKLREEAKRYGISIGLPSTATEISILWRFSLPSALSSLMLGPINWFCVAMLAKTQGGYGELGIYNACAQWGIAVLFLPNILSQVILPFLSNLKGRDCKEQYKRVFWTNVLINFFATTLIVLPIFLGAKVVMSMYGAEYAGGAAVLRIVLCTAILQALNSVIGSALVSKGRMWLGFAFNASWAVVLILAATVIIDAGYGAMGLAIATFIAYAAHSCWQFLYAALSLSAKRT